MRSRRSTSVTNEAASSSLTSSAASGESPYPTAPGSPTMLARQRLPASGSTRMLKVTLYPLSGALRFQSPKNLRKAAGRSVKWSFVTEGRVDFMTGSSKPPSVWYLNPYFHLGLNCLLMAVSELLLKVGATATSEIVAPEWLKGA